VLTWVCCRKHTKMLFDSQLLLVVEWCVITELCNLFCWRTWLKCATGAHCRVQGANFAAEFCCMYMLPTQGANIVAEFCCRYTLLNSRSVCVQPRTTSMRRSLWSESLRYTLQLPSQGCAHVNVPGSTEWLVLAGLAHSSQTQARSSSLPPASSQAQPTLKLN